VETVVDVLLTVPAERAPDLAALVTHSVWGVGRIRAVRTEEGLEEGERRVVASIDRGWPPEGVEPEACPPWLGDLMARAELVGA
jgi:hypothetical protein